MNSIYINDRGKQYQISLLDFNNKKTYVIFVKAKDEEKFKTIYYLSEEEFDNDQDAYDDAINNITNDYKRMKNE